MFHVFPFKYRFNFNVFVQIVGALISRTFFSTRVKTMVASSEKSTPAIISPNFSQPSTSRGSWRSGRMDRRWAAVSSGNGVIRRRIAVDSSSKSPFIAPTTTGCHVTQSKRGTDHRYEATYSPHAGTISFSTLELLTRKGGE